MLNEKTVQRYLDYLELYTQIIFDYSDDLKNVCKKKRTGEVKVNGKKYTYFALSNGITLVNQTNQLEINFIFNDETNSVYFEKSKFHEFIESDLNSFGLGKNFQSNSMTRKKEYEDCFVKLQNNGKIVSKDTGFSFFGNL